MWALCESTRWAALPSAGGMYDQNPRLLDDWMTILDEKAKHEKREAAKRDREQQKGKMKSARRR